MGRRSNWKGYRNVVSLMHTSDTSHPTSPLRQVEAYWAALPRPYGVPRRSDLDPRGLENLLEHAFILERVAPSVARFRVAGQHLAQLAGMEVRGMPITALFGHQSRGDLGAALEQVFDGPAAVETRLKGAGTRLSRPVTGAMLLLPLTGEDGAVTRALGAIVTDARPGAQPQRLDAFDISTRLLSGSPGAVPGATATTGSAEDTGSFAEEAAAFSPAPVGRTASTRPHLRLVHTSK